MRRGADRMERRGKSREGGEGVSPFFPLTRDAADAVTNPDTNTNTQRITRGEESKEGGFDEDWVETTNVAAFRSLAHWIEHHHDNEDEMSYSTRIDEKGRTVYRFRFAFSLLRALGIQLMWDAVSVLNRLLQR